MCTSTVMKQDKFFCRFSGVRVCAFIFVLVLVPKARIQSKAVLVLFPDKNSLEQSCVLVHLKTPSCTIISIILLY